MELFPGVPEDEIVETIIQAKFGMTKEEAKEYIKEYLKDQAEAVKDQLLQEVENCKQLFEQATQAVAKTIVLSAGIPPVMANPMTIPVAQNLIQDILGNIKEIKGILGSLISMLTTLGLIALFEKLGSGAAVEEGMKTAESTAKDNISPLQWDKNKVNDMEVGTVLPITYTLPTIEGLISKIEITQWKDPDGNVTTTPPVYTAELSGHENIGKGLYKVKDKPEWIIRFNSSNIAGYEVSLKAYYLESDGLDNTGESTKVEADEPITYKAKVKLV